MLTTPSILPCAAALLPLLIAAAPLPSGGDVLDRYQPRVYRDPAGNTLLYRLFTPHNYDSAKRYPLILFLHGAGGRGDDNKGQISDGGRTGAAYAAASIQATYPCFILAPQCPPEKRWVEVDWSAASHVQPPEPSDGLRMTMEVLTSLQKRFSIDPDRIYVTGLSMGGYGTWDLIARYPDRFAAAVPICGGGDEATAPAIKHLPIWAFHGSADTVVKPQRSRNMISALKQAGAEPRYTEYPGVGHNCWEAAYGEPQLLPWLFAQKRSR